MLRGQKHRVDSEFKHFVNQHDQIVTQHLAQRLIHHHHVRFLSVLDRVTGNDQAVKDYIFEKPAKCSRCMREVGEKTLVELAD